jgi:histone deacetylase 1/2
VFEFSQISAGGSLDAAYIIKENMADVCVNWAGGLHHAKKSEASGFCYINDIVLAILELLRYYPRVLYVDIDVHHGDGVEEAFYLTNRVMTVSFHQYGNDFFPGTGDIDSVGCDEGLNYSLNVPLLPGIKDDPYFETFKTVMARVMDSYRPDVVVLQCGADSITDDRLGQFNMSSQGHGRCVDYMLGFNVPVMLLGGGGYTIENVARCWTYETSIALSMPLEETIPPHEYKDYYGPDHRLHINAKPNMEDQNKADYLNKVVMTAIEHVKRIEQAPGVFFHDMPKGILDIEDYLGQEQQYDQDDVPKGRMRDESEMKPTSMLIAKADKYNL